MQLAAGEPLSLCEVEVQVSLANAALFKETSLTNFNLGAATAVTSAGDPVESHRDVYDGSHKTKIATDGLHSGVPILEDRGVSVLRWFYQQCLTTAAFPESPTPIWLHPSLGTNATVTVDLDVPSHIVAAAVWPCRSSDDIPMFLQSRIVLPDSINILAGNSTDNVAAVDAAVSWAAHNDSFSLAQPRYLHSRVLFVFNTPVVARYVTVRRTLSICSSR